MESIFAYPGLGEMFASAVATRDAPTVQAAGTVVIGLSLTLLLLADLLVSHSEHRAQ